MKKLLILIQLILATTASAEIREAKSMREALSDVTANDIVVFDIDNTILEPAQTLGSDQWFEYLLKKYDNSVDKALGDWLAVQRQTKVVAVESETPALIRDLQNRGMTVISLTARPAELSQASNQQLLSVGVKFKKIAPVVLENATYDFGIIFIGPGANKGVVLQQFLKKTALFPTRILFVDDKQKNVNNMDKAFIGTGTTNINFRYSAADAHVHSFDSEIAELEWDYFSNYGVLIDDETAEIILGATQ